MMEAYSKRGLFCGSRFGCCNSSLKPKKYGDILEGKSDRHCVKRGALLTGSFQVTSHDKLQKVEKSSIDRAAILMVLLLQLEGRNITESKE